MAEAQGKAPAQVHYDEHWDRAIDLTVRRAVYGTLAGGIAAVLLARAPASRAAVISFGAGIGVGSAYSDSQRSMKKTGPS
mmetsp:Transcript_11605/g.34869  ORF Transcript_11605/g.34869 Transcript_11605/m.34869 type:complete len:80 (-) Transcript_11605:570-809(-)